MPIQFIVLSGGPGTGKTSVLSKLAQRGQQCLDESARRLIEERLEAGLSPRPEPLCFASQLLNRDRCNYQAYTKHSGPVFIDRGIIDSLFMFINAGGITAEGVDEMLQLYPHHQQVFWFPPLVRHISPRSRQGSKLCGLLRHRSPACRLVSAFGL